MPTGERVCEVCGTTTCGGQHGYDGPLPRVLGGQGMNAPPEPRIAAKGRRRRQSDEAAS